jgi:hypothetical protein
MKLIEGGTLARAKFKFKVQSSKPAKEVVLRFGGRACSALRPPARHFASRSEADEHPAGREGRAPRHRLWVGQTGRG